MCDCSSYVSNSDQKSFDDVRAHWLPEVKASADAGVKKVMLVNKSDLPTREFNFAEVKAWAESEGIEAYETSAKTGKNVTQVFTDLCRYLIAIDPKGKRAINMAGNEGTLHGRDYQQESNKDSGCCN